MSINLTYSVCPMQPEKNCPVYVYCNIGKTFSHMTTVSNKDTLYTGQSKHFTNLCFVRRGASIGQGQPIPDRGHADMSKHCDGLWHIKGEMAIVYINCKAGMHRGCRRECRREILRVGKMRRVLRRECVGKTCA